jgi:hypothetical protein
LKYLKGCHINTTHIFNINLVYETFKELKKNLITFELAFNNCRKPNLELATKAKACKGVGQK